MGKGIRLGSRVRLHGVLCVSKPYKTVSSLFIPPGMEGCTYRSSRYKMRSNSLESACDTELSLSISHVLVIEKGALSTVTVSSPVAILQ